ncbi:hypothetical protein L596_015811 [Steinernema carpocapsae]|uniref:Uncharacterized protein n=1 Tax=Steinernema carpocapsae TaxID=34508 RepID=A0A4U5NH56_STECR|nr:hypothetical protein L596_015811 [Steinernema carpocapsae]
MQTSTTFLVERFRLTKRTRNTTIFVAVLSWLYIAMCKTRWPLGTCPVEGRRRPATNLHAMCVADKRPLWAKIRISIVLVCLSRSVLRCFSKSAMFPGVVLTRNLAPIRGAEPQACAMNYERYLVFDWLLWRSFFG